jgi:hypothetical protein
MGGRPTTTATSGATALQRTQGRISGARPNLKSKEANVLEEFIVEFRDVFARNRGDYGRRDKVYHRIYTGDDHPIRQPHADFL